MKTQTKKILLISTGTIIASIAAYSFFTGAPIKEAPILKQIVETGKKASKTVKIAYLNSKKIKDTTDYSRATYKFLTDKDLERILRYFDVPPEPDPIENHATLLGVDVNNNLVRDDIERYILFDKKYYVTKELKAAGLQEARLGTLAMTIDQYPFDKGNLADMIGAVQTLEEGYRKKVTKDFSNDIKLQISHLKFRQKLFYDTPERWRAYASVGHSGAAVTGSGKFGYRYADFNFDNGKYNWSLDQYQDRKVPVYTDHGNVTYYVYRGKIEELSFLDWCNLTFKTRDIKSCEAGIKRQNKLFKSYTVDQLRRMGEIE